MLKWKIAAFLGVAFGVAGIGWGYAEQGTAPGFYELRVYTALPGKRDALAGWIEAYHCTVREPGGSRAAADGIEIDRGFDYAGERVEALVDIGRFAGLDEPEMPLRQGKMRILNDRTE